MSTQAEQDAKDARRYRWLRDKSQSHHTFYLSVTRPFTGVNWQPGSVDQTIDDIMERERTTLDNTTG